MNVKELDLLDKSILYVTENEKTFSYARGYTTAGMPVYTPPDGKNTGEVKLDEVIFLPITNEEFKTNTEDYFFGFRFLLSKSGTSSFALIQDAMMSITDLQIQYEVTRIRYYPDGLKSICIDKTYDALFPTQCLHLQFPTVEIPQRLYKVTMDILNLYCVYYVDKKI